MMNQNSQTRSRTSQHWKEVAIVAMQVTTPFVIICLLLLLAVCAHAQTCTLRTQGYLGGCSNVSVLYFTQTPQSQIARFEFNTFAGRFTAPNTARSFSIPTTCSSGGQVVITEVRSNGSTCSAQYSGNLPHNRPCDQCSASGTNGATTVHAANFRQGLAPNAIAAVFPDAGQSFTDQTAFASGFPLPTVLGGVSITMNGVQCELLSVTPGQINFHIPSDADPGPTDIPVQILTTRGSAPQFLSRAQTNPSAPGVFTLASNGTGPAASNWLIVKPNGLQIWQNAGSLSFNAADRIFLVLYGTGINEIESTLFINGLTIPAIYTGQSWMVGVQQMTFPFTTAQASALPSLSGAFVRVGIPGRSWDSQGFDVRR